ncbi:hypothetical protein BDY19DRAFT_904719 [Irpex rosettiformis]|uniref:Uncharacterized protein n=1 Tax=Irpex rosettiformis TaxID=378272 RepID=A0ACB8UAS2_9APHY|nr:hypothetical protein BDY19DRAFT_904719 [Irpex rosettiformis]
MSEASEDAFYLTFKPSRRQLQQGQSFLSLDLGADMRRTMSLRRKDTVTTIHGRSVPTSPISSAPPIPRAFSPILRRTSRDTLPSPKPAPSATLPQVPPRFRRPSNLTLSISTHLPELQAEAGPSSPTASSRHRATNSEPAVMPTPIRSSPPGDDQSYFVFSPVESTPSTPPLTGTSTFDEVVTPVEPLSAPPHITAVGLKATPSFRSTASVGTRQRNRSAALAALEGRDRTPSKRRPSIKRNFMSMSDDEDEDEDTVTLENQLLGVLNEEEDVVIPGTNRVGGLTKENTRESSKRTSVSSESKRSRRSTFDSLLSPLTNFIDFRDDEPTSRSWRSFVELA